MNLDQPSSAGKIAVSEFMQLSGVMTALAAAGVEPGDVDGYCFATVPTGYTHKDITDLVEKAQPCANRKRGTDRKSTRLNSSH